MPYCSSFSLNKPTLTSANLSKSTMFSSGVYGIPTPPPKSTNSKSIPASWCTLPAISIVDSMANLNGSGSRIPEPM